MLKLLFLTTLALARGEELDPIDDQIAVFKENLEGPIGTMTTSAGAPIESRDAKSTLNSNLLLNEYFIDSLSHFVRERVQVRPVHPKGAGAFGYFITTRNMSDICKADFLSEVGKVTPVAARLSMGATERGGSDLTREPRGFAVKFYTTEGNFDIPGFNTPMFTYKDPTHFVPFAHCLRKNPKNDFTDLNMLWDFLVQHPEGLFIFMVVFSDDGIPDGYQNMAGYSIHTYPLYNKYGNVSYARFQMYPVQGLKNLNSSQAATLGAKDPDYSARSLYKAIASGDYPTWEVRLQLMTEELVNNATFDVFDISKPIPEDSVPWVPIGNLVLNKLAKNYFADVEQLAFCPSNLVPGILPSPDKSFEARSFSYRDSERYRLGVNFDKISVNFPRNSKLLTYNRDGRAPVRENGNDEPNYYPNSFYGAVPYVDEYRPAVPKIFEKEADNFAEMGDYYENKILGEHRNRLAENMGSSLCGAVNLLQEKIIVILKKIHVDLAERIVTYLNENNCTDS